MSASSPARRVAFAVLRRVFEDGAYADRALRSESAGLDERDRALARQLAYGSVQRARTLDHAIETLGRRPVRKLDAPVRAALRLGAYQLAFLDGVPRYAAVNESVELVRGRAARAGRSVRERRPPPPRGRRAGALRGAARGNSEGGRVAALVPGLGRRDLVARARRRTTPAR